MLVGFREGVREGTYHGKHLPQIAQGLLFLDSIIGQSQSQLEQAQREEKEAVKRAKEAIKQVCGNTQESLNVISPTA